MDANVVNADPSGLPGPGTPRSESLNRTGRTYAGSGGSHAQPRFLPTQITTSNSAKATQKGPGSRRVGSMAAERAGQNTDATAQRYSHPTTAKQGMTRGCAWWAAETSPESRAIDARPRPHPGQVHPA